MAEPLTGVCSQPSTWIPSRCYAPKARNQASKQAMNHLLHQLEEAGYLVRRPHTTDRRTRVVRLTDRGWRALEVIRQVAVELEQSARTAFQRERQLILVRDAIGSRTRLLRLPPSVVLGVPPAVGFQSAPVEL